MIDTVELIRKFYNIYSQIVYSDFSIYLGSLLDISLTWIFNDLISICNGAVNNYLQSILMPICVIFTLIIILNPSASNYLSKSKSSKFRELLYRFRTIWFSSKLGFIDFKAFRICFFIYEFISIINIFFPPQYSSLSLE